MPMDFDILGMLHQSINFTFKWNFIVEVNMERTRNDRFASHVQKLNEFFELRNSKTDP